jgi:hypothetical protein
MSPPSADLIVARPLAIALLVRRAGRAGMHLGPPGRIVPAGDGTVGHGCGSLEARVGYCGCGLADCGGP